MISFHPIKRIVLILDEGSANLYWEGPNSKSLGFVEHTVSVEIPHFSYKNSHGPYLNYLTWMYSNNILFTKTGSRQNLACGL